MSPKSLLRHPMAVSTLEDFTKGGFQEVLDDTDIAGAEAAGVKTSAALLGQGLLRPARRAHGEASARTSRSSASSSSIRCPAQKLAAILKRYQGREARLGSGRAAQHGCLDLRLQSVARRLRRFSRPSRRPRRSSTSAAKSERRPPSAPRSCTKKNRKALVEQGSSETAQMRKDSR